MSSFLPFTAFIPGFTTRTLTKADAGPLQRLYERCDDYAWLMEGVPPPPNAALEEFDAVPEGRTIRDKFMVGLFHRDGPVVGMIEGLRRYPDEVTWWLGLMMLAPEHRGEGVGRWFYEAFERWVMDQGVRRIELTVVEENARGFRFWRRQGFHEVGSRVPKRFGNKQHRVIFMRRTVAAPTNRDGTLGSAT